MSEQDIVKVEYLWESELNKTVSEVSYLVTPPATVPKYKKVKVRVFGAHYACNIILHLGVIGLFPTKLDKDEREREREAVSVCV